MVAAVGDSVVEAAIGAATTTTTTATAGAAMAGEPSDLHGIAVGAMLAKLIEQAGSGEPATLCRGSMPRHCPALPGA